MLGAVLLEACCSWLMLDARDGDISPVLVPVLQGQRGARMCMVPSCERPTAAQVFVLDGTAAVDDAMAALREAASHPALAHMPLLLLINKADLPACIPNVPRPVHHHTH